MKYLVFKKGNISKSHKNEIEMYADTDGDEWKVMEDDDLILMQRNWRDAELKATDWIVPIIDHPNHEATLLYRVALRDWPSTSDFPLTQPIM